MIQSSHDADHSRISSFCSSAWLCRSSPLAIPGSLHGFAADHTPPPVQPATSFPAVEVHDNEHVAIAVEPYDTKEKESIFRVDYIEATT